MAESVDHTGERFKAEFYSKEKIQTPIQQTGSGTYMGCNWLGSSPPDPKWAPSSLLLFEGGPAVKQTFSCWNSSD